MAGMMRPGVAAAEGEGPDVMSRMMWATALTATLEAEEAAAAAAAGRQQQQQQQRRPDSDEDHEVDEEDEDEAEDEAEEEYDREPERQAAAAAGGGAAAGLSGRVTIRLPRGLDGAAAAAVAGGDLEAMCELLEAGELQAWERRVAAADAAGEPRPSEERLRELRRRTLAVGGAWGGAFWGREGGEGGRDGGTYNAWHDDGRGFEVCVYSSCAANMHRFSST